MDHPESTTQPSGALPDDEHVRAARAEAIRERAAAAYLYASTSGTLGSSLDARAWKAFRDQLLAEAGAPRDPIEVMLVEVTALAFHTIGRLFTKSAIADHHEVAATYAAAATKLTAEFRRTALALQTYRSGAAGRLGVVTAETDREPAGQRVA